MPNRAGVVPFRWDVRRREQLGRLLRAPAAPHARWMPPAPIWNETIAEIRTASARVLARAGDARLVFIGRSPESLFDYLTGALADTPWVERLDLLSVSMPYGDVHTSSSVPPAAVEGLYAMLRALRLSPAEIASAPRPVALVDVVNRGSTFGSLAQSLATWARREGVDVNAVRRRLRFVGMTVRTKNSPNTWRWFQRTGWTADFPRSALRGVSIPGWFWGYLGNYQEKMMPSNDWTRWGTDDLMHPVHEPEAFNALRVALRIHEHARTRAERERFAAELTAREEMREPWLRSLVVAIRRSG
jgi:hypothetical protein